MHAEPIWISRADLEAALADLAAQRAGRLEEGCFGPGSITWKISREAALFAGSFRAALLQLAHPWVAQSIADHSRTLTRPVQRFHRTFRVVFTMIFGSFDQAAAAARFLHELHRSIRGEVTDPVEGAAPGRHYEANEAHAMTWVLITLLHTAVTAYEALVEPLDEEDRNGYVRESARMAALFGISPRLLPGTWNELDRTFEQWVSGPVIRVTPTGRRMADGLLGGTLLTRSLRPWSRQLASVWMPEGLRGPFGLEVVHRADAERLVDLLRGGRAVTPECLATVPPFREAGARVGGRRGVPPLTMFGNLLWIGRRRLGAGG